MYAVLLGIVLVGGAVALVGWALAHGRQAPVRTTDDLGPIHRAFPVAPDHLRAAVLRQTGAMRGVKVFDAGAAQVRLNVRPSAARLDDAMGLFVTVSFAESAGQSWYQVTGQAKSRIGIPASSERALCEFERQLRMGMKRTQGLTALGSDLSETGA